LVTEPQRAARPRGTTANRALTFGTAAFIAAAACLAGCSNGAGTGSGTLFNTAQTTSPSASASASHSATATPPTETSTSADPDSGGNAIPTAAWIASSSIPLDAKYHWAAPSSAAKAAKSPVLSAVQDCRLALSAGDRAELGAFPAAQADLAATSGATGGQDDWSAQETILATGDTSSGDVQGIYGLYTDLVAALKKCAATASGAKLTAKTSQGPTYAATITIPTSTGTTLTWHEYLAAPYGYLVELSLWVAPYAGGKPGAGWVGAPTDTVLSALQSGPCSVTGLC
jgi:hypothetical protein